MVEFELYLQFDEAIIALSAQQHNPIFVQDQQPMRRLSLGQSPMNWQMCLL
jgi:hypothetical protein